MSLNFSFGSNKLNLGGTATSTPAAGSGLTSTTSAFPSLLNPAGSSTNTASTTSLLGSTNTQPTTTSLTLAPATSTTSGASQTTNTSSQSTSVSSISFKVLEDYINKWMNDLDSQEKDFLNQATQLNALDKLMIENGEKIIDISSEINRVNNEQDQLEEELNFVFSQQNDLEQAIKRLEVGIEQMPMIPQQAGDTSRIEMYKMLIEVDNQLKTMSIDLKDIIKRLNDTNMNLNDPIAQISKILNAHVDSLNWIEENTGLIQNQVDKMSRVVDDRLKENEVSSTKFFYLS